MLEDVTFVGFVDLNTTLLYKENTGGSSVSAIDCGNAQFYQNNILIADAGIDIIEYNYEQ